MIGEILANEADLAIAPLTVSSKRESAIDFSVPFMNVGISIMVQKSKNVKISIFNFQKWITVFKRLFQ